MTKVLVVEDCQELAELISLILPSSDFVVSTVSLKEDALNLLTRLTPDIIVWDADMLHESGKNALSGDEILSVIHCNGIPLVMLSTDRSLLGSYSPSHVDAVMEKPFNIDLLEDKIRWLLYKKNINQGGFA